MPQLEQAQSDFDLAPGSPTACAKGCTCAAQDTGTQAFRTDPDCPLHGLSALATALDGLSYVEDRLQQGSG